jgi:AcrR family transcriptional regulator
MALGEVGGRLEQAAMALFETRGYDRTTVEQIAARAGVTERTFFRYFADKREVLFGGAKDLERLIVDTIANVPAATGPLEAVTAALQATASMFEARRATLGSDAESLPLTAIFKSAS